MPTPPLKNLAQFAEKQGQSEGTLALPIAKGGHQFVVARNSYWPEFWEAMQDGRWEPYTFQLFDKLLTPDTTYIDIGAWIGPTVLYASRLCWLCYAFEPDPVAYTQLETNLRLNRISNVVTFEEAILDRDGETTLGGDCLGNSMTRIGQSMNRFPVKCRSLPAFFSAYAPAKPVFIKMDAEGAEELILKDEAFFALFKPTIYLSTHPQWFVDAGMGTISEIARLYQHNYPIAENACLFTDSPLQ